MEGEGWVQAENLEVGDNIRNADGSTGEVEAVEIEQTQQEMYNLTVDEAHTFFVGEGQWLVHNADLCDPTKWPTLDNLISSQNPRRHAEEMLLLDVLTSPYNDMKTHIPNIYGIAVPMAKARGFSGDALTSFQLGVIGHDIGKHFNPEILQLSNFLGTYTPAQRLAMQGHVWYGARQLQGFGINNPMILNMARYHHPDYHFVPFPNNSPEYIQILRLADSYGANREARGYKAAYSHLEAFNIVQWMKEAGYVDSIYFDLLEKLGTP